MQRPQRSEDERRGQRRAPAHPRPDEGNHPSTRRENNTTDDSPFTTAAGSARLKGTTKGPDQMP